MNKTKVAMGIILLLVSNLSLSAEEHHNLTVKGCRSYPTGNIQIRGDSSTDNEGRHITYTTQMFSEKVLDRYLSMCMTAFASGALLRTDYLECSGTTCTPTANSTGFLIK